MHHIYPSGQLPRFAPLSGRTIGLLLNATIVLAWAATRVAGFPALFGFVRLPVEPVGLVATVLEIALLVLLLSHREDQDVVA